MNLAQFDDLLARIGARISLLDTNYRRSISASERLSICLRYLATGDSYRTIANSFRLFSLAPSNCLPTCHYQELTTEDHSRMSLWLMRPFHFGKTLVFPGRNLWRVYRRAFEVNVEVAENALRGNILVGEVDPLPGLGRVAANNSAREAIWIREAFKSYFSAEGTVPWQDNV
ncbi:unnamed protein product [Boreogadus saida]